jgi:hypothetical protein
MLEEKVHKVEKTTNLQASNTSSVVKKSWDKIAPLWPLENIVAVNPLSGLESLPFEEALDVAEAFFQQECFPDEVSKINLESIKWLQVYFDYGQSTIQMPSRSRGFLNSLLSLLRFDNNIHSGCKVKIQWLKELGTNPIIIIDKVLLSLNVSLSDRELFLTLMLTTLPGWASHIKYRTNWSESKNDYNFSVSKEEYLAFRLILTYLIWPQAINILCWHRKVLAKTDTSIVYSNIRARESKYSGDLLNKLENCGSRDSITNTSAQFVFCIDTRSELLRYEIEKEGSYETFGYAGFFGVPVSISNEVTGKIHSSCPVLLSPQYNVSCSPEKGHELYRSRYGKMSAISNIYNSLKSTVATAFGFVDMMGPISGVWMGMKSFAPRAAHTFGSILNQYSGASEKLEPNISSIPIKHQVSQAQSMLRAIGLTGNFAPIVFICGHGSSSENNAFATSLDCGACGGRQGDYNAQIMAKILNSKSVRDELRKNSIDINNQTVFIAASHNTTTDELKLLDDRIVPSNKLSELSKIKVDIRHARKRASLKRCQKLGVESKGFEALKVTEIRSKDWSQVRPEWGLAGNAAFIIAPRWLSKEVDLDGRVFLHSYEWSKDEDLSSLRSIMTAPMIVAQWINAQYLFSTLNNSAYGGGSKVTGNITGKIGIMQGNASDLMTGLPLQSVFSSDKDSFHEVMRLNIIIYAPLHYIYSVVEGSELLLKLVGNGWINIICKSPESNENFTLMRDLSWIKK